VKIALLCPSRERLNLKLTLISSIITTVKDINNVSLYLGVDEDDPTREITLKIASAIPFVKIVTFEKTPNEKINIHKLWNICARASTEEIIAMIGDDMIFRTQNWDEKIISQFENGPKDNILLVYGNDGHRNGELCVNAFTHRKYMDINGVFLREEFIANWVDNWLQQVFTALNRIVYLPDVLIEHNHWVFGGREIDNAGKRLLERNQDKSQSDALWAPLEPKRVEEVIRLAKLINVIPDFKKAGFSREYWNLNV